MGICASTEEESNRSSKDRVSHQGAKLQAKNEVELLPPHFDSIRDSFYCDGMDDNLSVSFTSQLAQDANVVQWFDLLQRDELVNTGFGASYNPHEPSPIASYCLAHPEMRVRYKFQTASRTLPELDDLFNDCFRVAPYRPTKVVAVGSEAQLQARTSTSDAFSGGALAYMMGVLGVKCDAHIVYVLYLLVIGRRGGEFRVASPSKLKREFNIDEWCVTRETWRKGCLMNGIVGLKSMEAFVQTAGAQYDSFPLSHSDVRASMKFAFRFLAKDGVQKQSIPKLDGIPVWKSLLDRKWSLLESFCDFVAMSDTCRVITGDQWDVLVDFALAVGSPMQLATYDSQSNSWPTLMDAFVEHAVKVAMME